MAEGGSSSEIDSARPEHYSWFRSEPMSLCQLYLQTESAYHIVSILGEHGICQFRDLNRRVNAFQRKFVSEVRRCTEMERKLAAFEKEIVKDEIEILDYDEEPKAPSLKDIAKLETQLEKLENDLIDVNKNRLQLKTRLLALTELRYILKKSDQFFEEAQSAEPNIPKVMRRMSVVDPQLMRRFSTQISATDINIPLDPVVDIITLTGTILASRFLSFERMLWRVSRGNILLKRIDIEEKLEDPVTGELQQKCLFILVFQGEKLRNNCKKICDGYHTTIYQCPEKSDERKKMHASVMNEINDMMLVIRESDEHRRKILVAIAKNLKQWKVSVVKMRSIYETMNLFSYNITDKCLIAECWMPDSRLLQARLALQQGQVLSNSTIPSALTTIATHETPPTYNVTNKFTSGFQNIMDSYGHSNYGEVNPAPYAIISFPFIFAVMFGDIGHGIIMALFALYLVLNERKLSNIKDEIFGMFFSGRYIILFMGLFSIYTGAIYNDIFSKSINLFGSVFDAKKLPWDQCPGQCYNKTIYQLVPINYTHNDYQYPFGVDPVWQLASNKVLFTNTFKMKISVILGVLQMFFGVILSLFNHIHFKRWINIFAEFIPQVIFLLAIFGWMNFMIFWKWFAYNAERSSCAPSILITLINMFMFKQPEEDDICYLQFMFPEQSIIHPILIILAVVCIPWLLFLKPLYICMNNKKSKASEHDEDGDSIELAKRNGTLDTELSIEPSTPVTITSQEKDDDTHAALDPHGDDGSMGDILINQGIHTIEYCLGSISHTASYLRLWALSLAHAQLSEVLWNMVMKMGFMEFGEGGPGAKNVGSAVVMVIIFFIWAILTVAILILMEGLSAFLHAIRLHWVEFMSKFYTGAGYPFMPFSFKVIISEL